MARKILRVGRPGPLFALRGGPPVEGEGVRTRTGLTEWGPRRSARCSRTRRTRGPRTYGKTRAEPYNPQLAPSAAGGKPEYPKKPMTRVDTPTEDQIPIDVPALVGEDLFAAVQEQLEENRKEAGPPEATYLVTRELIVCKGCGYALPRRIRTAARLRPTGGSPTPTTAAAAAREAWHGTADRSCAGPGESGPISWTERCGKTSAHCCPSPSASERNTSGGWKGPGEAKSARPVR